MMNLIHLPFSFSKIIVKWYIVKGSKFLNKQMAETDGLYMTFGIGSGIAKGCTYLKILHHRFSTQRIEFPQSGDFLKCIL